MIAVWCRSVSTALVRNINKQLGAYCVNTVHCNTIRTVNCRAMSSSVKKGLLQRLQDGVVVGDGGFIVALEKRGYVMGGAWTPEVVVERPHAVLNLHREFLDAGSDVMQSLTFRANTDRLQKGAKEFSKMYTCENINREAIKLAQTVAKEGDALVSASLSQTVSYIEGKGKSVVQKEFKDQIKIFLECEVDFLIGEFFDHVEEMEWAIEEMLKSGLPVVASMSICQQGDKSGVSVGECGVRMARAGAHVVGVNCQFDPREAVETVRLMKKAVEEAGLKVHYITQPLGSHVPDVDKGGYWDLREFPFAMEPRTLTRFDVNRYAREAYEAGVRYIGGCCGFEAYHVRAIYEELEAHHVPRPKPFSCTKHVPWGGGLQFSTSPYFRAKANSKYWETLEPATGRPRSAAQSIPEEVDEHGNIRPKVSLTQTKGLTSDTSR